MHFITRTAAEARELRAQFQTDPLLLDLLQLRVSVDSDTLILAERIYDLNRKHHKSRLELFANLIELDCVVIYDFSGRAQYYSLTVLQKIIEKFETWVCYKQPHEREFLNLLIQRKLNERKAA